MVETTGCGVLSLWDEVVISDIGSDSLMPEGINEFTSYIVNTVIQMEACDRGVTALPRWLVNEFAERYDIHPVRLGEKGVQKQIYLGIREEDTDVDYIKAFLQWAQSSTS